MPFGTSNFELIFNQDEKPTPEMIDASRAQYLVLLQEIQDSRLSNPNSELIDAELKNAILAYFIVKPSARNRIKRLVHWGRIFRYQNRSIDELSETNEYVYNLVCEVLLDQHDNILNKYLDPTIISKALAKVLFLQTEDIDLSVMLSALEKNPTLLRSPVLTTIFIDRLDDYKDSFDDGVMDFISGLKGLFVVKNPALAEDPDALMGWTWFWIIQASVEDQNTIQDFIQKYYNGSTAELVSKIIIYANSKSLNIFEILGKICLLSIHPSEQSNEVRDTIRWHLQTSDLAEKLVASFKAEYDEFNNVNEEITALLAFLPGITLADEDLFQITCEMISNEIKDKNSIISEIILLNQIVQAMAKPDRLWQNEPSMAQKASISRALSKLLDVLEELETENKMLIFRAIQIYLSIPEHAQSVIDFCIYTPLENLEVEDRLALINLLPFNFKVDAKVISLISNILQDPSITEQSNTLINHIFYDYLQELPAPALAHLLNPNQGYSVFIQKFFSIMIKVLNNTQAGGINNELMVKLNSPEVTVAIGQLERCISLEMHRLAEQYPTLELGAILHQYKYLFNAQQYAFLRAPQEQRQRINDAFIEQLNESFDNKLHPTINAQIFPNMLADLIKFKGLTLIHQNLSALQEQSRKAKISLEDFTSVFLSEVVKSASEEDLDEEDDDPTAGLPFNKLPENEKTQMRNLLESSLKTHIKKFHGIDAQKYMFSILKQLPKVSDPAKYLRPLLATINPQHSSKRSLLNENGTKHKIQKLLENDFPITQEVPKLQSGHGIENGNKKPRI